MKKLQIAFLVIVGAPTLLFGILYLFGGEHRAKIRKCDELGVATYKELGMYPYMSSGVRTEDHVHGQCVRSGGMAHNPRGLTR